ncbi:protein-L-isoaspartate O-methyltransferase [Aquisalimonas sp.]|uniref:protein-L-isoaspartate O-methyltransferase family protein n=1 Tax=Aquisalimonas sp. TaxID=1872621 RepID=UPI0025C0AC73|nr:protein-L-isoaspartate O-methyltransferase [Aquisalimonas sp.]
MSEMNVEQARFNMVEQQIRTWEVLDPRVLDTLQHMPREHFVPDHLRNLAFSDMNLPLGHGEVMLSPKQEGRLLQAAELSPSEQVLEVGTGSAYLTACLARMSAHVTSIDIYQEFLDVAGDRLKREAIRNVALKCGDAAAGWDDGKRYDAIIVGGGLPELHKGFHYSLTVGGRLVVMVGEAPIMEGMLITRVGEAQWATESLFDTWLPPLVNAPRTRRFDF